MTGRFFYSELKKLRIPFVIQMTADLTSGPSDHKMVALSEGTQNTEWAEKTQRMNSGGANGKLTGLMLSLLVFLSVFPFPGLAGEEPFSLAAPVRIRPYEPAALQLHVPAAGTLRLSALVNGETLTLLSGEKVKKGSLSLPLDGLTAFGQPLPAGNAVLSAELDASGQTFKAEAPVRVLQPAAALAFVLLSRETLPGPGGEDLLADYQLTAPGRLEVMLYAEGTPEVALRRWSIKRKDTLPHRFRWDKRVGGSPAAPGNYIISFAVQGSSQAPLLRRFALTAEEPAEPDIAVTPPGSFLQERPDDAGVWTALSSPITVVDIGALQHQGIYSEPSEASPVLGMVHGQTAGLEVLETGVSGFARVRAARHGDGAWVTGYVPQAKLKTVLPDGRYGLLIDKKSQTMSVYEGGRFIGELRVSTGVFEPPGDSSFETLSGTFLTEDRIAGFTSEGFRYNYAIRIDGGNLIHEVGHRTVSGRLDYMKQLAALGIKASHGCVRVDSRPSPEGLNAWWLYTRLPRNTKVLVLPDGSEPEALASRQPEVTAAQPLPAPVAGPEPELPLKVSRNPLPEEHTRIVMTFGGDSVLGSEERSKNLPESFHAAVERNGPAWPFSGLRDIFKNDDLTMVNLENVLKDSASGRESRLHTFRGPESFADILRLGSVELVNLANNHFIDYGQDGKNSTRRALGEAGVAFSGYSSLHVLEKGGVRVGFAGIRETIWLQGSGRVADEIARLKEAGCQYVVYTCHFGNEYGETHNELQTRIARGAIDAGADLVIGHHPHVVQGVEEYGGGLILYSLGNLVFGGNLELKTFDGLLARVTLDFSRGKLTGREIRMIPVITSGSRPGNDFRPVPALGEDKARILDAINRDSLKAYPEIFSF